MGINKKFPGTNSCSKAKESKYEKKTTAICSGLFRTLNSFSSIDDTDSALIKFNKLYAILNLSSTIVPSFICD
jgi:hypothetical protein